MNVIATENAFPVNSLENKLTPYLQILEDTSGEMSYEDVKGKEFEQVVLKNKNQSLNKKFTDSAIWVKIPLKIDLNNTSWMLEQYDWYINELDLYVENVSTKEVLTFHTGNMLPFSERLYPHNNLVFPLELQKGNEYLLYLRYKTKQPLEIKLTLWEYIEFQSYTQELEMALGFTYGGFVMIMLYTFLLFLSLRESTYFYYIIYVFSTLLTMLHINGDLFRYFYPDNPEAMFIVSRCYVSLFVLSIIQFARSFLRVNLLSPLISKSLTTIQVFIVCVFLAWPFIPFPTYQVILFTMVGISFLSLMVVGVYALRKGHKEALFYLIAWIPPSFTCFLAATRFVYTFPIDLNYRLTTQSAFLLEMCLLAFALAYRIKLLKEIQDKQESLVQSEKMASLGRLVSGVAHEMNTPIGIGVTAASLLHARTDEIQNQLKKGNFKKSLLEQYLMSCESASSLLLNNLTKMSNLITSFKHVSADIQGYEKRELEIREYIEEIIASLVPEAKKESLSINIHSDKEIIIDSYPGALVQIITNLVSNAILHAFDGRDHGNISIHLKKEGKSLLIIFADDGKGIPKKNLKDIFEPFYTTKRNKGGTGLGLHIVFNLVFQQLKGTITCESEINKGTSFKIMIPLRV
ncbi:MAG: sensor histidine kinase [Nitrospinae bacterium]|nr:sensor histidine kinase [Nitrospinota bacterium]